MPGLYYGVCMARVYGAEQAAVLMPLFSQRSFSVFTVSRSAALSGAICPRHTIAQAFITA